MTAAELAPLLRGALIEKTGGPWTAARWAGINIRDCPSVRIRAGDDPAAAIGAAVKGLTEIPQAFRIVCGAENGAGTENGADAERDFFFITAPDFAGLDRVRDTIEKGGRTGGWDLPPPAAGPMEKRAAVARGRVALVTGGAQGFGGEIVRGLVEAGAQVFIADLNLEGAQKLAASLNGELGKTAAYAVEVNVADEASAEAMTDFIALTAGGLDLCISNAGVLRAAAILDQDMASFKFVTDINYTAFAVITKHCGRLMKAQNLCAPSWITDIIQINSKSGLEGSNKNGAYSGSKFGSIGLVQSFALELVEYRIKVNAVCPGNFYEGPLWSDPEKGLFVQYLKTGKVPGAKTTADVKAYYEAKVPMKRGCSGPDVIRAVLYLIEQIYETGQALPVTGGQVMLN
ncbi:MAG: SDR family NAD(P)-dependent oxidoreductase [Treponema sp.]|jgi:sorbitol-6-phosphate 2-dehydrogenase|nr:SDR family NAD(P)-dependent oxidoreductase [Treponema sp.]